LNHNINSQELEAAIAKAKTQWLKSLLAEKLPELFSESLDYQIWFDEIVEHMEHRGLVEPQQQKNYLSDVRNAIKVINPNHPALNVVKFDTETWTEINHASSDRIAERKTKFIRDPEAIVKRATTLLKSYRWAEIAAGLAVLTGRRHTEVIQTAEFEYKTKYSVIFSGSLKRRGESVKCVFEIPTLAPAAQIIEAIASLRDKLGAEIPDLLPRQINNRYSEPVAKQCERFFSELVPSREGKDNLYTHLFRAVYATLAAHWYCPPSVPEIEYRAAIQGHYQILDEKDPTLRHNFAASRNYFDYKIADGEGNIDGRLGLKLSLPDVRVIERYANRVPTHVQRTAKSDKKTETLTQSDSSRQLPSQPKSQARTGKQLSLPTMKQQPSASNIPSFLLPRLESLAARLGLTPTDTIEALFHWTEVSLALAESLELEELNPNLLFAQIEELQARLENKSVTQSSSGQNNLVEPTNNFERESINNLCASVRLLSEAISRQNNMVKTPINSQQPSAKTEKLEPDSSFTSDKSLPNQEDSTFNDDIDTDSHNNSESRRQGDYSRLAEAKVNEALDKIIEFNNQSERLYKDKLYISTRLLYTLTGHADSIVNRVKKQRQEEIKQHHQQHELNSFHNARGNNPVPVREMIPFQRLDD
jgi:Telomere resolvase